MPEESLAAHAEEPRVSTGNASLDAMLSGGLVARRPYLIVGASGTGKSTLALQFLCEGVRRGERVLLVTLEEPPNEAHVNHRGLAPEIELVEVFDAIPDIMRYERVPFKDIASVRAAVPFREVPTRIRRTPELASVEVTITALEQMLRSEVARRSYTRVVIDSLTALQYFCMKGFDHVAGAQTFLRFLSELRVTTVLTVESPLEDVDTPERMLARGEIRLFRWELDGQTVRALGVEKFRGSPHDVRLHPYRIGPHGIDINLRVTISRDTRQLIEPVLPVPSSEPVVPPISPMEPLEESVRDFVLVGAPLEPLRESLRAALTATSHGDRSAAEGHITRARALTVDLAQSLRRGGGDSVPIGPGAGEAYQRIVARSEPVRAGLPPTRLPTPAILTSQLERVLALIPPEVVPTPVEPLPRAPGVPLSMSSPSQRTPEVSPNIPAPPVEIEAPIGIVAPPGETLPTAREALPIDAAVQPSGAKPPPPSADFAVSASPRPASSPASSPTRSAAPPLPLPLPPPPPPPIPVPPPSSEAVRPRFESASTRKTGTSREPPPLPTPPLPAAPRPAAVELSPQPLPVAPVPSADAGPRAPTVELSPTPIPTKRVELPLPPPPPPILASPTPSHAPSPPAKRRKRASTAAKKRPRSTDEPAVAGPTPTLAELPPASPPPLYLSPTTETTMPAPAASSPSAEPGELSPPPKPKRRAPRKRKAPPVVAVIPGDIPTESLGSPPSTTSPPTGDRPTEEPK